MEMTSPEPFAEAAQAAAQHAADQVAALCWRRRRGAVQVLLISSRDSGRWVIPKGWPIAGLSTADAAAREAWEEAGVEGKVQATPLGAFGYDKLARMSVTVRCLVAVHALRVLALKDRFPEAGQRRRAWFNPAEAAGLVAEPQLQHLLRIIDATPDLLRRPA